VHVHPTTLSMCSDLYCTHEAAPCSHDDTQLAECPQSLHICHHFGTGRRTGFGRCWHGCRCWHMSTRTRTGICWRKLPTPHQVSETQCLLWYWSEYDALGPCVCLTRASATGLHLPGGGDKQKQQLVTVEHLVRSHWAKCVLDCCCGNVLQCTRGLSHVAVLGT
jgi:hypothetical protein